MKDSNHITKKIILKAHAEERIQVNEYKDLREFFSEDGWITIKADNPYIQGYYFNILESGSVSGDHFF